MRGRSSARPLCTSPAAVLAPDSGGFTRFHLHSQSTYPDNESQQNPITVYRYSRADLLRILRLTARQLASWEKAELVAAAESYSFFDLLQIKKVRDLCAKKVRPAVIRQSLQAMQKQVAGMENPLLEAGAFSTGHRVAFRHEGKLLEPIAGQFMFDFSPGTEGDLAHAGHAAAARPARSRRRRTFLARNCAGRRSAHPVRGDRDLPEGSGARSQHAAAHINVGTLYYNRQEYGLAEKHYRAAIEIDPRYALAYFDLGNVLDETGRVQKRSRPTRPLSNLLPPTLTRITISPWPTRN